MERTNLLGGPPATYLLEEEEAAAALRAGEPPADVAARFPAYSAAWAALAARAYAEGDAVTAYAYARTGYHRGLDQLRRAGWKGFDPTSGLMTGARYVTVAVSRNPVGGNRHEMNRQVVDSAGNTSSVHEDSK